MDAWPVTQKQGDAEVAAVLTARQALQASWRCLIDAANGPRKPGTRGIDQIAVTYPADLMPEPRGQLKQALRELGMVTVHLDFDESISPAIFHLEQLFGNMEEIGCEAFKAQCVREGNVWAHHMLVLDIGAGTTDISLIPAGDARTPARTRPSSAGDSTRSRPACWGPPAAARAAAIN